jgi:UDP-N-acetylmuramoylalanine--D-glutamate ligase
MQSYVAAKQRIFNNAKCKIVCRDDAATSTMQEDLHLTFGLSRSAQGMSWDEERQVITHNGQDFIDFKACTLSGLHNVLNIQAASLIALQAGIGKENIVAAAQSFEGLSHRYQVVESADNITWINDSKATNPGATKVSLEAAKSDTQGQLILIAGGDAKQADLSELNKLISDSVHYLIAIGKDGRLLMENATRSVYVDSMLDAVKVAKAIARDGDTVLLSPACASLDMFNNFEHRGSCFMDAVEGLVA